MKYGIWALAILLCAANSPASEKASKGANVEKRVEARMKKMAKRLDLTEDQQVKMKAIHEKHKASLDAKKEAKRQSFKAVTELMQGNSDESAIREAYKKLQVARSDADTARFEMLLEIRSILTPEQRTKFRQFGRNGAGEHFKKKRGEREESDEL